MYSTMVSRQILCCLFLALLSRYADSRKSFYLDPILMSLQRLEHLFIQQIEQSVMHCHLAQSLYNELINEHQTSSNESTEATPFDRSSLLLGRALDFHTRVPPFLLPKDSNSRRSHRNSNANENTNINANENTNVNFNRHHRRAFNDVPLNKAHNKNVNSNINFNSNANRNRDDIFDFSDEDEA